MNVRLGLLTEGGRGQASTQLNFTLNSPIRYQVYKTFDTNGTPHWGVGGGSANPDGTSSDGFHHGEYNVFPIQVYSLDGSPNWCAEGLYLWSGKTLTRFYWVEADGTQHEMRDVATGGQALSNGGCWSAGPNRGKVFVSTDGSGATYVSDHDVRDGIYVDNPYPIGGVDWGGWLFLKDGKRVRISFDNNRGFRDRNGNVLPSASNYLMPYPLVDSLNRVINKGTGTPTECNALVPGTNCGYWSYKGFGGAERRIYFVYEFNGQRFFLPNGKSYRLYYNTYGDLIRIDLPSGGSIEYDFEPGLTGPQPDLSQMVPTGYMPGIYNGGPSDFYVYRRLTERRVYREGHVLDSKQTFSKPENTSGNNLGYVEKKNYDGNNNLLSTERHYFYGSVENSFDLGPTQYPSWKDGLEYRSETYSATGTLLRTVNTSWEQRAPVSWWTSSPDDAPANDPRLSQVTTILENGDHLPTAMSMILRCRTTV